MLLIILLSALPMACGGDDESSTSTDSGTTDSETTDSGATDSGSNGTPDGRCGVIEQSITDAGFGDTVSIRCENEVAYLLSTTYPTHDVMNGITATNEQIPVPAPGLESPIPLEPVMANAVTTRDSSLGIAVNGVPIYDYTTGGELEMDAEGNTTYDERRDTILLGQLDNCGGHSGRGDDYHYHKEPSCMLAVMPNANDNPIIGWAYDGYPMYGKNNPDGSTIGASDLGPCNGQADETFGYRYHTSDTQPYIIKCMKGEVNEQDLPRVSPFRDGGAPINVTGLAFTNTDNGDGTETRRLSYTYQSADYYIQYATRTDSNYCFDVESRMCNEGQGGCDIIEQDACYCRSLPNGESLPSGCEEGGAPPPPN